VHRVERLSALVALDAQAQGQAEGWSTSEALFEGWMDGRGGPEAA